MGPLVLLSYFVIFEKRNLYKKIEVRFDFEVSKISAQKFGDKKIKNSQTVPHLIFQKKNKFRIWPRFPVKKMWAFDKIAWVIFTKKQGVNPKGVTCPKVFELFLEKKNNFTTKKAVGLKSTENENIFNPGAG